VHLILIRVAVIKKKLQKPFNASVRLQTHVNTHTHTHTIIIWRLYIFCSTLPTSCPWDGKALAIKMIMIWELPQDLFLTIRPNKNTFIPLHTHTRRTAACVKLIYQVYIKDDSFINDLSAPSFPTGLSFLPESNYSPSHFPLLPFPSRLVYPVKFFSIFWVYIVSATFM